MSTQFNDELYGLPIEPPVLPHYPRLVFLRWLAEQGRLEHLVQGPVSGTFANGAASAVPAYSGKSS